MFYWRFYKKRMAQYPWIKRPIIVLSLMNLILSITAILFAFISKVTLDGVLDSNTEVFVWGLIGLVGVILVQWLLKITNQRYLSIHQATTHKQLQTHYFDALLHTEMPILKSTHSGAWMNHLDSDVVKLSSGLLDVLPRFVFMMSRFILAFAVLLYLDPIMAIIITGSGMIIYLFGITFKGKMKERHHLRQDAESDVRSYLQEHLDHMEVIKSFEAEPYTLHQFNAHQEQYQTAKVHQQNLSIWVGTTIQALFMIIYAGILAFGAYRISLGFITVGGLVAMLQLVQYLQSPFRLANTLLPTFTAMEGSHERLTTIEALDKEPLHNTPLQPFDSIKLVDLTFSYPHQEPIIHNLSVTILPGQTIQIVGPSGIGKTTLLHLFLGLLQPTSGTLEIVHENETTTIDSSTRSYFTYVPQRLLLKSGSIRENIIYNRESITEEHLHHICKLCEIHNDIVSLERGYDTMIGEHGGGLSEGQLQRLAIARALIGNEPVILLDEITSALDQKTEQEILHNISGSLHKTILIISHRELPENLVDAKIVL